jgi:predicted DNA-binding protein (UPF0278 family)
MVVILSCILGKILAAPVTAPAKMGMKILEAIRDEADKELHPSESQIREKLIELETLLESGRISEQDYEAREAYLMERWREIQENKGG